MYPEPSTHTLHTTPELYYRTVLLYILNCTTQHPELYYTPSLKPKIQTKGGRGGGGDDAPPRVLVLQVHLTPTTLYLPPSTLNHKPETRNKLLHPRNQTPNPQPNPAPCTLYPVPCTPTPTPTPTPAPCTLNAEPLFARGAAQCRSCVESLSCATRLYPGKPRTPTTKYQILNSNPVICFVCDGLSCVTHLHPG